MINLKVIVLILNGKYMGHSITFCQCLQPRAFRFLNLGVGI